MTVSHPILYLTRHFPSSIETALADLGEVLHPPEWRPPTADDLLGGLAGADVVVCTVADRFTPHMLRQVPRQARLLASFGVGVDHIPLAVAEEVGLAVSNTPGVLTEATADLTMALILATLRRLGEGERLVRAGQWTGWEPTQLLGRDVSGRVLGIVGLGRIGTAVARRASCGFGMRVQYANPRPVPPESLSGFEATPCPLDELLQTSDIVSLHCPATPETYHLLDRTRLQQMAPGSILINAARGSIVDERALAEALRTGPLAGAGLDVFEHEPEVPDALRQLDQVVLLPHLGSATVETRVAMGEAVLANIRAFLQGDRLPHLVAHRPPSLS